MKEISLKNPHALIVEDDSKNMRILGTLLTNHGVTHTDILDPTAVSTSLQALESVDVIFLDLEMPELNGYDVLKMVQTDARFAHVPVVACTVHTSEVNNALEMGFHSFLAKPLEPSKFRDQLTRILNGERVWNR